MTHRDHTSKPTRRPKGRIMAVIVAVLIALVAGGCTTAESQASPPRVTAQLSAALAARGDGVPSINVASPEDGATVTSPVALRVKFEHLTPKAAGATIDGEVHLHAMVDVPCLDTGLAIPKDETHVHFGNGAADIEVELEPGVHELCIQAADGFHAAVAVTDTITVNVVE